MFYFQEVANRGGHSTYRIIQDLDMDDENFAVFLNRLEKLGCSYEHGNFGYHLYVIDVPPSADIFEVYDVLREGREKEIWDFEEGHCGHDVSKNRSKLKNSFLRHFVQGFTRK